MRLLYNLICLYLIFVITNNTIFSQKYIFINSTINVPVKAIDGKADYPIICLLALDTLQLLNDTGFLFKFQLKNIGTAVDTLRYPLNLIFIAMVSEKGRQVVFPSTVLFNAQAEYIKYAFFRYWKCWEKYAAYFYFIYREPICTCAERLLHIFYQN